MHFISTFLVFVTMLVIIDARSSSRRRSCPEEYRELRRRSDDDSSSDSDDDQRLEDVCEQAIDFAARQRNPIRNQLMLSTYCAHHAEALELERANDDTLCENKKRAIDMKRKRQQGAKKRDDDDSTDSDDQDNDDKRRALQKRELQKRFALRFIRKRMS